MPTAGKGKQTADFSWWPKVNTWDGSDLDLGCWTPQCEHWFTQRLNSIVHGHQTPKDTTTWARNLRYQKEIKVFFPKVKELTYAFLTEKYPNFSAPL